MKTISENVITNGRYELAAMLKRIDTIWLQGDITDADRDKLIALARKKATPDMGYASVEQRLKDIENRLTELEKAGKPLETEEYPAWKQPTGAHDAYHTGDKIMYNGRKYKCVAADNFAVTYPPDVLPGMWEEVYA